jgi:hypothetical protein
VLLELEVVLELRVLCCTPLLRVPSCELLLFRVLWEELRVVLLLEFREVFEDRVWATMPGAANMERASERVVAIVKNLLILQ